MPNADRSVRLEDEEGVGVVGTRVNQVVDIVRTCTVILEVTAGVRLIARPEEIAPVEGEVTIGWITLTTEVLYMLPKRVDVAFTIGAAAALYRFQMRPDLRLVGRRHIVP